MPTNSLLGRVDLPPHKLAAFKLVLAVGQVRQLQILADRKRTSRSAVLRQLLDKQLAAEFL